MNLKDAAHETVCVNVNQFPAKMASSLRKQPPPRVASEQDDENGVRYALVADARADASAEPSRPVERETLRGVCRLTVCGDKIVYSNL